MSRPLPNQTAPVLSLPTLNGKTWTLSEQTSPFTLIVFYRGDHCPICRVYLRDLAKTQEKFQERNIGVIAVSSNSEKLARKSQTEWQLDNLMIGHSLSLETARNWGLYISNAIKESEPAQFSEPGLALIRGDGTLYATVTQTMPFTRPRFDEILGAIDFITANNYPARGDA